METQGSTYKKRTQKDYSLSLKLQIVQEIEQGLLTTTGALDRYGIQAASTVRNWLKKYGNFDYQYTIQQGMSKTPEQRILELEQQVKLLEKQKNRAEYLAERADKKAILFDMMIDIAEKEFNIPIRKKQEPK
ncbi:transposase [Formosa sp. Hel1_33_131]|jgi:transposase-like protein|uniref:transposase n=1 Tax=Formosa sp. Hel1_33_131 TaxID=1336794 RepID=UPI00084E1EC8|nr:transposase [Formosa sp. Hel1_33_131]AOR28471.1 transposase [Formosa sp. Hel1_33_131]